MKTFWTLLSLAAVASGCASSRTVEVQPAGNEVITESAGAEIVSPADQPRDMNQRPYGRQKVPEKRMPTNPEEPPTLPLH